MKLSKFVFLSVLIVFISLCLSKHRPKVGLALSGGGAKGLAHIGVLKVLEEAGIKVDYIAGTSMGSIVGGLYAIGYTPEQLKKITNEMDWEEVLSDITPRKSISIDEKDKEYKYITKLPFKGFSVGLPAGVIVGQQLSMKLSELTWRVHHIKNFDDFQIPFRCVATDIVNGKSVEFKEGNLADALRASMSIPSAFAPMEIDGELYVDGGVLKNFPVSTLKDMGADIIIGVNVAEGLVPKEELNSLISVTMQAVSIQEAPELKKAKEECDYLIEPNVEGYDASSFGATDSLLVRGERAARKQISQLKALAERLNEFKDEEVEAENEDSEYKILEDTDFVYLDNIIFMGRENVTYTLLEDRLDVKKDGWVRYKEIREGVERIYASGFFEKVDFILKNKDSGVTLIINVKEKKHDFIGIGFNYNDDTETNVFLNFTFLNPIQKGSKLRLTGRLSEDPSFTLDYTVKTDFYEKLTIGTKFFFEELDLYVYHTDRDLWAANLQYQHSTFSLYTEMLMSNSLNLGVGGMFDYVDLSPIVIPENWNATDTNLGVTAIYGYIGFDNLDRNIYPTSGAKFNFSSKYVFDDLIISSDELNTGEIKPFWRLYGKLLHYMRFSDRVTLFNRSEVGTLIGKGIIPEYYDFYLGGQYLNNENFFPFYGLDFMSAMGHHIVLHEAGIQYEVVNNIFLTLRGNVGYVNNERNKLSNFEDYFKGGGLTFGYSSFIGPLELTLMYGDESKEITSFINIGFKF